MGLKQPHWLGGTLLNNNTTVYSQPTGTGIATPSATETRAIFRVDQATTIRNLVVRLATAPGGTATRTVTFRKNGVDQALSVTFGAADISQTDSSNSFSVAAGDLVILKFTATNTPATTTFTLVWEGETADAATSQYAIGISEQTLPTTGYLPLFSAGGVATIPTVAAQADALVGAAGTIPSYRIQLENAPTSTHSRTFVLEKNGVAQDGTGGTPNTTITITGTATSGTATFSLAVAPGDLIRCKHTASGSPGAGRVGGGHSFVATTPGELSLSCTSSAALSSSTTLYSPPSGGNSWTAEASATVPAPLTAVSLADLRVTLDAALGASATHAYTLRVNAVDTAQTVSIASLGSGAGPSAGAAVALTAGQLVVVKGVSSAAASTNRPHLAMRLTVGEPPPAGISLVTSVTAGPGANGGTTAAINTTGADLLVISVSWYPNAGTINPPTDSKGNTWIPLTGHTGQTGGAGAAHQFFYAKNATVGTGHTFTVTASNSSPAIIVQAFAGTDLTAPFTGENGFTGYTLPGTWNAGSVTPTTNGSLVLTGASTGDITITVLGGFTQTTHPYSPTMQGATGYLVQPTAAAIDPQWTNSAAQQLTLSVAVFRPAATLTGTPQLTQLVAETLTFIPPPTAARLTHLVVETLSLPPTYVPLQASQLVAELLNTVPASPLAASAVTAEIVLAIVPNQARVTALACELIVIPSEFVSACASGMPIDPL